LSIPEEEEILSVIAIGKRGEEPALRPRKPLEEIVKIY
jgi:nitroreductase